MTNYIWSSRTLKALSELLMVIMLAGGAIMVWAAALWYWRLI